MNKETKYMDIKEFRELGLLQEINRRLLHPLGLALEVETNDDGTESLGGIRDCRDDPAGIVFDTINHKKIRRVEALQKEKFYPRDKLLGFIVQVRGMKKEQR